VRRNESGKDGRRNHYTDNGRADGAQWALAGEV
jgi:hypothetical protein